MERPGASWTTFVAILLVMMSIPASATAEDNDNDEDQLYGEEEVERPDPPLRRPVYDAGRISLGVDGVFSRTSARAELLDSGHATDTTRFFRVDPWVTVGVVDHLHIGLRSGLVSRRISQEGGDASSDNAIAVQPTAVYFVRVTDRFGLYGELSPGMYFGRSQRTIPPEEEGDDPLEDEQTNTLGFVITTGAGINYRLSDGFQLRFGLAFNGLWGRERVEVDGEEHSLSMGTTNIGTQAGIRYTF